MGGAPQKERGSEASLSKAEGSRGEVSLLSANPAPQRARDNQTRQGFRLSSSTLLPQTLGLYRQARGFCEGWTNHVKGQIVICHSYTNHVKGQVVMCLHCNRSLSCSVHVHGNQESQSKVLTNNLGCALISSARRHLSFRPQS